MQMTAVSQMAASIAHEINQPLRQLSQMAMPACVAAHNPPDLDEARAALECILDDGRHAVR